jgi:hypothetical protein
MYTSRTGLAVAVNKECKTKLLIITSHQIYNLFFFEV